MVSDDVMILDAGEEVYVWIGQEADEEEKVKGLKMAQNYLDTDPTMRYNACLVSGVASRIVEIFQSQFCISLCQLIWFLSSEMLTMGW